MNQNNLNHSKIATMAAFLALLFAGSALQAANAQRPHATMSKQEAFGLLGVNQAELVGLNEAKIKGKAKKAFRELSRINAPDKKQEAFIQNLKRKNPGKEHLIDLAQYQDEDSLAQEIKKRQQKPTTQLNAEEVAFINDKRQLIKTEIDAATEKYKLIVSAGERLDKDYSLLDPEEFAQEASTRRAEWIQEQLWEAAEKHRFQQEHPDASIKEAWLFFDQLYSKIQNREQKREQKKRILALSRKKNGKAAMILAYNLCSWHKKYRASEHNFLPTLCCNAYLAGQQAKREKQRKEEDDAGQLPYHVKDQSLLAPHLPPEKVQEIVMNYIVKNGYALTLWRYLKKQREKSKNQRRPKAEEPFYAAIHYSSKAVPKIAKVGGYKQQVQSRHKKDVITLTPETTWSSVEKDIRQKGILPDKLPLFCNSGPEEEDEIIDSLSDLALHVIAKEKTLFVSDEPV